MSSLSDKDAVNTVVEACQILGRLDVTHGALGHVSYRADDNETMIIKGKGPDEVGLRYTRSEDIVEVDFNADMVDGRSGLQAPGESYLHFWIYKMNPEVRSVIHMHPDYAVLLTICGIDIQPIYGAYDPPGARIAVDGVPVYGSSVTIHDNEKGETFAKFMKKSKVAMMHGHGITVVGKSVEDATVRAIAFNRLVTMTYLAHSLGNVKRLPEPDIESLKNPEVVERVRGSAGGDAGIMARWRYVRSLAEDVAGD